jgi:hypothetical protein
VPTSTTKIVGATLTGVGSFTLIGGFNVPDQSTSNKFDILPTSLQSIYQTWYVVKCTGYIAIGQSGWYEFDTSSDDGSNLYIDGGLLVNNDGLHSTQNVMAAKFLQANIHSFELDYLQGSGNESLIVNMNGNLLPAEVLYH